MTLVDRRAFIAGGAFLVAAPGALVAGGCRGSPEAPLAAVAQNWVVSLHPDIERISNEFRLTTPLAPIAAPPGGVDIGDILADAERGTSTWDAYLGITPWVEMARLVDGGAIEPWDDHVPPDLLANVLRSIRAEGSKDRRLYSWPFVVDVTMQAWNGELVERAGLDPTRRPDTWDELFERARVVVRTGVAPFGCVFDPRGWRSLAPITHSLGQNVYTEDGLFDLTHPATVEALETMRRMVELAPPDLLDSDGAYTPVTPDEAAFAAQTVAYSVKYTNAHVRYAAAWPDPARLEVGALPASGSSVFWTTGLALLRYGKRKVEAAAWAEAVTQDAKLWERSLGRSRTAAGQLPASRSLPGWSTPTPDWVAAWVTRATEAFSRARPIHPHRLGEQQFTVARPYWEEYLRGNETNARRALLRAERAVRRKLTNAGG